MRSQSATTPGREHELELAKLARIEIDCSVGADVCLDAAQNPHPPAIAGVQLTNLRVRAPRLLHADAPAIFNPYEWSVTQIRD
jgi:hypothetical protein